MQANKRETVAAVAASTSTTTKDCRSWIQCDRIESQSTWDSWIIDVSLIIVVIFFFFLRYRFDFCMFHEIPEWRRLTDLVIMPLFLTSKSNCIRVESSSFTDFSFRSASCQQWKMTLHPGGKAGGGGEEEEATSTSQVSFQTTSDGDCWFVRADWWLKLYRNIVDCCCYSSDSAIPSGFSAAPFDPHRHRWVNLQFLSDDSDSFEEFNRSASKSFELDWFDSLIC